ncbi:MAG: tyrosine-type recombinase/integrase [Lachnospiraceae bacterium]|nr:tyrosine-type recombinase/integrase [Lachnospiraceae bacterium]
MTEWDAGAVRIIIRELSFYPEYICRKYNNNRSRRKTTFRDLDYICCSSYGIPRGKSFHVKHFKALLQECGLPDIRWHDLRVTYCTLLLKQNFSTKAVSKLMGHSKKIITMDVYGDNKGILLDGVPEIEEFIKELKLGEEGGDDGHV